MELFVNPASEYKRDLNIYHHYVEIKSKSLSQYFKRPIEETREYVKRVTGEGGKFAITDPRVRVIVRDKNGDRQVRFTTFNTFLKAVDQRKAILSPSMTAYLQPSEKVSQYALSTDKNIKARKVIKKEMFAAEQRGDNEVKEIKNIMQTGRKLTNNGMSGGFSVASTPLYCRSAHSSLTSCCRSATSTTNAFNEKFAAGNRHYYSPEIVLENISTICLNTDLVAIQKAVDEYSLTIPTVDHVMACIYRSSRRYWTKRSMMAVIRTVVEGMTDMERTAFLFVSDLYHLRMVNPEFVRNMIVETGAYTSTGYSGDVNMSDGDARVLATMKCAGDIIKIGSKAAGESQEIKDLIKANYLLSVESLEKYRTYIRAFLVTKNTPANIAMIPSHVREVVLASDTDSSIFTVQEYVDWLQPDYEKRVERIRINATVTFFISQQVVHLLATVSGNIGVAHEHLFRLAMKNEYYFETFVLTNMGKHYFATQTAREGNFFDKPKLEQKGVHLRNSNVPKEVRDRGDKIILDILDKSNKNEQFSVMDLLQQVGDIERFIVNSIKNGETIFLTKATVKPKDAYKKPFSSNYIYHLMWEEVFAPKYGAAPPLQYIGLKANLGMKSKTAINEWLESLPDQDFAKRMRNFMEKYGKTSLNLMVLPADIIMNSGLPEEVIMGIDIRTLIVENLSMVYSCLESLGLYFVNEYATRLVSDEH